MTECNAIIEANNEIDNLKRENKKLNELCVKYDFEVGRLEEENKQLKMHMNSAKAYLEGGHTKKAIERLKIIDIR